MDEITSLKNKSTVRTLSVACGIAHLMEIVQGKLSISGFHIDSDASIKLILDFPFGYGFNVLKRLGNDPPLLIVLTWNPCREYVEDLWDLEPRALLAGEILPKQSWVDTLCEVIDRVANGERYRLTPGPSTPLTRRERHVLHYVARGWHNNRIAQQVHVEEQTVKNTLRSVYRKLEACNHAQAALYYCGALHQLEDGDNRTGLPQSLIRS